MASERAPSEPSVTETVRVDPVTAAFWYAFALVVASLGAAHQLAIVLPDAYLLPDLDPPHSALLCLELPALGAGLVVGTRRRTSSLVTTPRWLLAAALLAALSAPAMMLALGHGASVFAVAGVTGTLGLFVLGAGLASARAALGRTLLLIGAPLRLGNPFRLLACAALAGGAAAASSLVGILRAGLGQALVLAICAALWPALVGYLGLRAARSERLTFAALAIAGAISVSVGLSDRVAPVADRHAFVNPVILHVAGTRQRFDLTSGQDAFELYVDGRLKASSLDATRYFEALVHPAMALARPPRRVALLGGGTGLGEHEILRHAEVESLTVVVTDAKLVELARRQRWLRTRARDALADARVHLVEDEPILWARSTRERFDVILSDLPDPETPIEGKSYTRHFFRTLAQRLEPGGILCVQGMSPLTSPQSFAIVGATLEAAGLAALPYHAPVPTLGDWGFWLARVGDRPTAAEIEGARSFLSGVTLTELTHLPRDFAPPAPGEPSLLFDQRLTATFRQERGLD